MQNNDQHQAPQIYTSNGFNIPEISGTLLSLLKVFLEQAKNDGTALKTLQNAALLPNIQLPPPQPPEPVVSTHSLHNLQPQLSDQTHELTQHTCAAKMFINGSLQPVTLRVFLPEPPKLDGTTGAHWYEAFGGTLIVRSKNLEISGDPQGIQIADERLETSQYIPEVLPKRFKLSQDQFVDFQTFIEKHCNEIVMVNLSAISDTADVLKLLSMLQKQCGNLLRITIDHRSWTCENFPAIREILENFSCVISIITPKSGQGGIRETTGMESRRAELEKIAQDNGKIIADALKNQGHHTGPFTLPSAQMVIELLNIIAKAKEGYSITKNIINKDILRKKILQSVSYIHLSASLCSFKSFRDTLGFAKQTIPDFGLSEIANLLFDSTYGIINELRKSFFFKTHLFINLTSSINLQECLESSFKNSPTNKTTFGVVYLQDSDQFHFYVRGLDGTIKHIAQNPEMLKKYSKLEPLFTHLKSIFASNVSIFPYPVSPFKCFCKFDPLSSSAIEMSDFTINERYNLMYIIAEILGYKVINELNLRLLYLLESLMLLSLDRDSIQKLGFNAISSIPQTHQIPVFELLKLAHIKDCIDLKPYQHQVLPLIDKTLSSCIKMTMSQTFDESLSIANLAMSLLHNVSGVSDGEDKDSAISNISNFFHLCVHFYRTLFDEMEQKKSEIIKSLQKLTNEMVTCKLFEETVNFLPIDTLHNVDNLFSIFHYLFPVAEITPPPVLTDVYSILVERDPNSFSYRNFFAMLDEVRDLLKLGKTGAYIAQCKQIISIRSHFEQDKNLFSAVVELIFAARANIQCLPVLVDLFEFAPTEYEKIRLLSENFLTMKLQGTFDITQPGMLDIFKNWLGYVLTIKKIKPSQRENIEITCINLNKVVTDEPLLALSVRCIAATSAPVGINKKDHLVELAKIHVERNKLIDAVNFYEKALECEARKKPRQQSKPHISRSTKNPTLFKAIPLDAALKIRRELFSLYIKLGDQSVAENNFVKAEGYYRRGNELTLWINEEVITTKCSQAYKKLADKYMALGLKEKAAQFEQMAEQMVTEDSRKRPHEPETGAINEGEPSSKMKPV